MQLSNLLEYQSPQSTEFEVMSSSSVLTTSSSSSLEKFDKEEDLYDE